MYKILTSPYRFIKWFFESTTYEMESYENMNVKLCGEIICSSIIMVIHWFFSLLSKGDIHFNIIAMLFGCLIIFKAMYENKKETVYLPITLGNWVLFLWSFVW